MDKIQFMVDLEMLEKEVAELGWFGNEDWHELTLSELNDVFQRLNAVEADIRIIYEGGLKEVRSLGNMFCTDEEWKTALKTLD